MPATPSPVAAYDASSMCSACWIVDGLNIPAIGSICTICPLVIVTPVGRVHPRRCTMTTNTADAAPLAATISPAARCARVEIRSQPYR